LKEEKPTRINLSRGFGDAVHSKFAYKILNCARGEEQSKRVKASQEYFIISILLSIKNALQLEKNAKSRLHLAKKSAFKCIIVD
jgi:hypothetical protein